MMEVAIPPDFSEDRRWYIPSFCKAPTFTLVDIKDNLINSTEIIKNNGEHFVGNLTPLDMLIEKNIQALICLGLGQEL